MFPAAGRRARTWREGPRVKVEVCEQLGMREQWRDVLWFGADLLLDSLPQLRVIRDNYSSCREHLEAAVPLFEAQQSSGVLESMGPHKPTLTHPIGMVAKKLEPGDTGPQFINVQRHRGCSRVGSK